MRKIIISLFSLCLLLLLAYAAYRGFEVWKQNHFLALAKQFGAKGDFQNEFLSLEQALHANPRNIEACRMAANLAEVERSRTALLWRKKVLELDPSSLNDRLALAQTALFAQDIGTATSALAGVNEAGKKNAGYWNVAGQLALALNQPTDAESDFAEAARLDPSNPAPLLSLSVVQLHRTNSLDMAEARITLKRISLNSTNIVIRNQAKRELIMDALRFKDYASAVPLARELAQQTNAVFSDKLLWLDTLKASQNSDYNSGLAACEREAARDPAQIHQLTLWLLERGLTDQALGWLRGLPPNVQTNQPTAEWVARCEALAQDWTGLQKSAAKQDWGNQEPVRHAYLSRALREQGLYGASKAEWDIALKSANNRDLDLKQLFLLAAGWRWPDETLQILWSIVNSYPQDKWAVPELTAELYVAGRTRPLMQLFSIECNRNPDDLDAKNNLAMTAMLLRANEMKPYDLAREVHDKAPTNSFYTCTYAFSLYLQGKDADALKLMQQLDSKALKDNSTDGYYGLILKATGNRVEANTYLKRSTTGRLLPEEQTLFQDALINL